MPIGSSFKLPKSNNSRIIGNTHGIRTRRLRRVVYCNGGDWRTAMPYIRNNTKVVMAVGDSGLGTSPNFTQAELLNMLNSYNDLILDVIIDTEPFGAGRDAPLLLGILYNGKVTSGGAWVVQPVYADVMLPALWGIMGFTIPTIFDYTIYDTKKIAPFTTWARFNPPSSEGWAYKIFKPPTPNTAGVVIRECPYDGYWYDQATFNCYMNWYLTDNVVWLGGNGTDTLHPPPIYGDCRSALQAYALAVGATFLDLS